MRNRFPAVRPIINYQPITRFGKSQFSRHFRRFKKQMPKHLMILRRRFGNPRDALLRNNQDVNRRFVSFDYEMTCGGRRVAIGQTRHIFLNRELRPVRLPDKYAALFGIE